MNDIKSLVKDKRVRSAFDAYVRKCGRKLKIVGDFISSGSFSTVYEIRDEKGVTMVMKAIDTSIHNIGLEADRVAAYAEKEIEFMKQCNSCPYIMDLLGYADVFINHDQDEHIYLLFMPKLMEATEYFSERGYKLSDIIAMSKDICKALDFCHSKKILHRDVKIQNIFYDKNTGRFVLSDLGVSREVTDTNRVMTRIGSIIAPEIMQRKSLEGRMNSDIFSLGMTMLLLNAEMAKSNDIISKRFNSLNADIKEVLMKAVDGDPTKRYQTAKEFLAAIEGLESKNYEENDMASDVRRCVDAFSENDFRTAVTIAENGHRRGITVMSCLYAYMLACQKRFDEARDVLEPLVNRGDAVATGLYGIIGRFLTINKDPARDKEMVDYIVRAANANFSVAQYYVGRWMIDGDSGFSVDMQGGMEYLFGAIQKGFLPAMYYLKKTLRRYKKAFISIESMEKMMEIAMADFSKDNLPVELVKAIASAYC